MTSRALTATRIAPFTSQISSRRPSRSARPPPMAGRAAGTRHFLPGCYGGTTHDTCVHPTWSLRRPGDVFGRPSSTSVLLIETFRFKGREVVKVEEGVLGRSPICPCRKSGTCHLFIEMDRTRGLKRSRVFKVSLEVHRIIS